MKILYDARWLQVFRFRRGFPLTSTPLPIFWIRHWTTHNREIPGACGHTTLQNPAVSRQIWSHYIVCVKWLECGHLRRTGRSKISPRSGTVLSRWGSCKSNRFIAGLYFIYHTCHGDYVLAGVRLSVCLSVGGMAQTVVDDCWWKLLERCGMWHERIIE